MLTCRTQVFEEQDAFRTRRLGAVVRPLPLAAETILSVVVRRNARDEARWRSVFRAIEDAPEGSPARAFSSPLALTLAITAYERRDPAELLDEERFPGRKRSSCASSKPPNRPRLFELGRNADRRHWLGGAARPGPRHGPCGRRVAAVVADGAGEQAQGADTGGARAAADPPGAGRRGGRWLGVGGRAVGGLRRPAALHDGPPDVARPPPPLPGSG